MIEHPESKALRGAPHRRRPDGVIEYWSRLSGCWYASDDCESCMTKPSMYPQVSYVLTWAEPTEPTV